MPAVARVDSPTIRCVCGTRLRYRALSELEMSAKLDTFHLRGNRCNSTGMRFAPHGIDNCRNGATCESDGPSADGPFKIPQELISSPSGISVLANLTDEVLIVSLFYPP